MKKLTDKLIVAIIAIPALISLLVINVFLSIWIAIKVWWDELIIKHLINNGKDNYDEDI